MAGPHSQLSHIPLLLQEIQNKASNMFEMCSWQYSSAFVPRLSLVMLVSLNLGGWELVVRCVGTNIASKDA